MSSPRAELLISCDASRRLDAAREWLSSRPRDAEVLVVAPSLQAGDDLLHAEAASGGTRFGAERLTLFQLATRLAVPSLARAGRVPATGLSGAAVIARAVHGLRLERSLDYFHDVAARPGFPATLARTFEELRREEAAIRHAFPDLSGKRGRGRRAAVNRAPRKRRGSRMSAAARKAVSVRMKKYWADRRKAKSK